MSQSALQQKMSTESATGKPWTTVEAAVELIKDAIASGGGDGTVSPYNLGTLTTGDLAIDLANGPVQYGSISGDGGQDINILTPSGSPVEGQEVRIIIIYSGSGPSTLMFSAGVADTLGLFPSTLANSRSYVITLTYYAWLWHLTSIDGPNLTDW